MSTELAITGALQGVDILAAADNPAGGGTQRVALDSYNKSASLDSSTTPAVETQPIDLSTTIPGGGSTDYDLTAAPAAIDLNLTVDATGKKLIAILANADDDNAGDITISPQGANAYNLAGGASDNIVLSPGESCMRWFTSKASQRDAVGASDKDVRVAGTAADTCEFILYFGT